MSRRASGLVVTRPSTARSLLASLGVAPASRRSTGTVTLALGRLHAPRSGHSEPARSPGWFGCYCLVSRALTSQPASQSVPACLLPASSHTAAPYRTYNLISAPACPHPPHGVPSPFPRPARSIPRPVQRRHRLPRSKPGPERPTLVCRPAGCRCRRSRVALVLQACPWPAPSRARPAPAGGQPRSTAAPGAPSQAAHTAHVGRGFIQAPRGMHVGPLRRLGLRGALPHNRPQRRPNHRPRVSRPPGSSRPTAPLAPASRRRLPLAVLAASLSPPGWPLWNLQSPASGAWGSPPFRPPAWHWAAICVIKPAALPRLLHWPSPTATWRQCRRPLPIMPKHCLCCC